MIRIMLTITQCSPFLQTISGEVLVQNLDFRESPEEQIKPLLKCQFTKKPGQTGYKSEAGFNSAIFEAIKDKLDTMIHSYARGMLLAEHDYSWVEGTDVISIEDWVKDAEVKYEKEFVTKYGKA